jgi:hypothetical protein
MGLEMTIDYLKAEYKRQTEICAETDYADKKTIRKNNAAVDRMYAIIDSVSKSEEKDAITNFAQLLNEEENRTHIWAAIQMLEKLKVDEITKKVAIKIIETEAKSDSDSAVGLQYWLEKHQKDSI